MPPRLRYPRSGFSIIEIVLALGILAFVGIALIGLIGAGLDSSRVSAEETACGLAARYVFSTLETDSLSAEDLSTTSRSPFNPEFSASGLVKTYYFTREGLFLGQTIPTPVDPELEPFFIAEAVIKTPPTELAAGVANQGVSEKELRAVALTIKWPVLPGTGAAPSAAKGANYSFLLSKPIYRKSLEGDR